MFGISTGLVAAGAIGIVVAGIAGFGVGWDYRASKCNEAALRAKVEDLDRQLKVWQLATADAESKAKELEKEDAETDKLLAEIRKNGGACTFTIEQRCRLLELAGGVCKQTDPPH